MDLNNLIDKEIIENVLNDFKYFKNTNRVPKKIFIRTKSEFGEVLNGYANYIAEKLVDRLGNLVEIYVGEPDKDFYEIDLPHYFSLFN